ncbi:hypothetical protein [Nesterenkonia haasae]|nr:hypothetical protein [Nesterenkonia haasae]
MEAPLVEAGFSEAEPSLLPAAAVLSPEESLLEDAPRESVR